MIRVEEKSSLLDEFSGQVQRHFPASVWRSLFEDGTGHAQFGTAARTIVAIECEQAGPTTRTSLVAAVNQAARVHGGRIDPCAGEFILVSCPTTSGALGIALAVQRTARTRLRMGIVTGRCTVARAHVDGQDFLVLLGKERARAEKLAGAAPAGTVQIDPDAFVAAGGYIDEALGSCVVIAEYDGDVLRDVTLTVPPDSSAEFSTFAGLGLT
ncbi:hypothetical protein [Ramlibacter algicola]|uniref:Uncharacterized protein n=1 Tax=Ramlibacter algicola TaxID=2795217 RepID=A0A934UTU4_9BURK|nr:hypothetical protein [Ramlibacter algicola]MBK0394882.1 hypothetical protein [Ramlibacter algicola]